VGDFVVLRGDCYVYVSSEEIEKASDFLDLSRNWLKRRYFRRLPEEGWMLAVSDDETSVLQGMAGVVAFMTLALCGVYLTPIGQRWCCIKETGIKHLNAAKELGWGRQGRIEEKIAASKKQGVLNVVLYDWGRG